MLAQRKREAVQRRHRRVRKRILGASERPRLTVYRSNRHIYAQVVDDSTGRTLVAASTLDSDASGKGDKKAAAKRVGELIAKRAKDAGVDKVVLDRGGRLYHGRVRSVADAAREGGLQI
ncbi:MAG: 50S ribosomal protein L18 [Actinomycetota bacterium]